jgi:Flp pilus assembly pilin Flp
LKCREETRKGERDGSMLVVEWSWLMTARLRGWCESNMRAASGQSTVEYALVGALVVIAAATALTALGGEVTAVFNKISATLSGAASASH